jgi:hypothetical protein
MTMTEMITMPDKPIKGEVVEGQPGPVTLSELVLYKTNAAYYKLITAKQGFDLLQTQLQLAQQNFNTVQVEFQKQLDAAQESVHVSFKEWDLNTGVVKAL